MLQFASLRRGLQTRNIGRQHQFSSLTESLRSIATLYANKEWKSVLTISNSDEVIQFVARSLSKTTPLWPDDKTSITTIFDSAANCDLKHNTGPCMQTFVANGYGKYHLFASVGPVTSTRLCLSYPEVRDAQELKIITSAIEDAVVAPNLLLLNLKPPVVSEYLIAGHLNAYLKILGEQNLALLKQSFWSVLQTVPDGTSVNAITRSLIIQLMATKQRASSNVSREGSDTVAGQLTAAALQRVVELHGVTAGTKLLQDVYRSVGLLDAAGISRTTYTDMLHTVLSRNTNSNTKSTIHTDSNSADQFVAIMALLRLAAGNTAADVALRGELLFSLAKQGRYQQAVDLAALCVQERRWLGTDTLNQLLRWENDFTHCSGSRVVHTLLLTEHDHLVRLLDQAQSVLTAHEAGALILPSSVKRVQFMGQVALSNAPTLGTPRSARSCSAFELVLTEEEALQVRRGTLDLDRMLPPQDLAVGLNVETIDTDLLNLERHSLANPAGVDAAVRRQLELVQLLSAGDFDLQFSMDLLIRLARLGHATHSMLVVNKAVNLAYRLGQLSESQRAAVERVDCQYSWGLPPVLSPTSSESSTDQCSVVQVMPLTQWEETAHPFLGRIRDTDEGEVGQSSCEDGTSNDSNIEQSIAPRSQPSLGEMQMLLAVQFAAARHVNSLTLMRKCHRDAEAKDVPVNLSMALEAVSVFLFWKDYDSVQAVFDSLERTDGAQNALQLANELLLSLLVQDRFLDVAKVAVIVARLKGTVGRVSMDIVDWSAQDPLHVAVHTLLRWLALQREGEDHSEDAGRSLLDEKSALDAIAAAAVVTLDFSDLTQQLSPSETALPFEVLLLEWVRHMRPRHSERAAVVLNALHCSALAKHPRGTALLHRLTNESPVSGAHTHDFDNLLVAPQLSARRRGRAPFAAYPYDAVEMHHDDSNVESHCRQNVSS